jgi:hypothetical protein
MSQFKFEIESDDETIVQSDYESEEEFGTEINNKISNPSANTFFQYAQRCTICMGWLYFNNEIITNLNNTWQMVHKECVISNQLLPSNEQ